ncbi:hypothetical protein CYMTET_43272 [Cymbomonas tetramitiformis]|uniref:Uncharacterized protein n=1 Tax=Cymbomonas tetramitiformis TaxID=36881 RepID=A0AAE0C3K6_9CHLO|nr:hypothetical protein CYMTET_43272 [Cymbomonas tetramitiformis]
MPLCWLYSKEVLTRKRVHLYYYLPYQNKVIVALKSEIATASLDTDVFDFDHRNLGVQRFVNELVYDTLTYIVEPDTVAYGYLLGTDSVTDRDGRRALVDLIKGCVPPAVRQKHQSEHSALLYPARVDPRPILAMEQRLVRENRATDWTPHGCYAQGAAVGEPSFPVFYAAVKVKYPRLQDLHAASIAEPSDLVASIYVSWEQCAGGTPGTAAAVGVPGDEKTDRDDILGKLRTRLDKIQAFIKTQPMGGAPAVLPKKNRKGLDGFRVFVGNDSRVGFDPGAKTTLPNRLARHGGLLPRPVEECTAEVLHTLALCQVVYETAADNGMDAFVAAVEQHGAPAVVRAGATAGGVDVCAYGFAVEESDDSEDEGMGV